MSETLRLNAPTKVTNGPIKGVVGKLVQLKLRDSLAVIQLYDQTRIELRSDWIEQDEQTEEDWSLYNQWNENLPDPVEWLDYQIAALQPAFTGIDPRKVYDQDEYMTLTMLKKSKHMIETLRGSLETAENARRVAENTLSWTRNPRDMGQ